MRVVARVLGSCLVALAAAVGPGASAASAACSMDCEDFAAKSVLRTGADGRPDMVAVGRSLQGTDAASADSAIVVHNADGSRDSGFGGGDGAELVPVSAGRDEAHDVRVHPDGDLFVSGRADGDAYVARLNPDGSLDPACGGMDADPGVERFDPPGGAVERAVLARTPDFVVAAQTGSGEPGQVFKITDACELVPTFGTAGFAALVFGAQSLTWVGDVEVDGAGNIFVGGGNDAAIGSLGTSGSPNTGFGFGGYLPLGPGSLIVTGLVPNPAGGWFFNAQFTTSSFLVGSVPADGSSFNSAFVDFGMGPNLAGGVAAGDGDVFATGRTPGGTTGVARKDGDTLADVNSFDMDGKNDFGPASTGVDVQFVPNGAGGGTIVTSGFVLPLGQDADFANHRVDAATGALLGTDTTDFTGQSSAPIGQAGETPGGSALPPLLEKCTVDARLDRPCVDLAVEKFFRPGEGERQFGGSLHSHANRFQTMFIEVRNFGPDTADVELVDRLPRGWFMELRGVVQYKEFQTLGEGTFLGFRSCNRSLFPRNAATVRCSFRMAPGDLVRLRFLSAIQTPGTSRNTAAVSSPTAAEIDPSDNSAEAMITLWSPGTDIDRQLLRQLRLERRGSIGGSVRQADVGREGSRAGAADTRAAQAPRRLGRIAKVEVALLRRLGRVRAAQARNAACQWLRNPRARFVRRKPGRARRCDRPVWLRTRLKGDRWTYRIRERLPCGTYTLLVRATNRAGAAEAGFSRRDGNRADLRLC